MVLPTQPRRGVSPGGMPGAPMQGQGRGPNVGMPKAQSPIPSSVPGINDVAGTPDPDKIVELFTAYTSGELSREQLITQLNVFSEGQGGILGLLEGMETSPEGQQDNGMLADSPNPMGGPGLPSVSPPGTIPTLEEPLDERHQRIAALIMKYGLTPEDANQLSTELNPMIGGRTVSQEQVDSAIDAWNTRADEIGMPHVGGNTLKAIQSIAQHGGDYADMAGSPIGQIMGGIPGTNTGLFPGVTSGMSNMSLSSQSPVFQPAAKPTHTHDNFPAHDTSIVHPEPKPDPRQMMGGGPGRSPVTTPATGAPQETGELVYDEQTGQMVDSGTWMPPAATGGVDAATLSAAVKEQAPVQPKETGELIWAEELQQMVDSGTYAPPVPKTSVVPNEFDEGLGEVTPRTETTSGSVAADRAAWEERQRQEAMWAGGGSIGDAATGAESAERDAMWRGGGSVGDTAANIELQRRTAPTTYSPDTTGGVTPSFRDQYGESIPEPQDDRNIIPRTGGPTTAGGGGKWWDNPLNIPGMDWRPDWYPGPRLPDLPGSGGGEGRPTGGSGTREDPYTYDTPGDGPSGAVYAPRLDPTGGGVPRPPVRDAEGNIVIDVDASTTGTGIAEDPLFGPGAGKITGRPKGDITDLFGQAPAGYTGTDVTPTEEGYATSITEPGVTGFKTVEDFDFPELQNFLNSLSDEARTGMGAENLPGIVIDALTKMAGQRAAGNVQLAESNTRAAIAFLDRAAATTRDKARQALAESQLEIENQRQALEQGIALGDMTGLYGPDSKATIAKQELDRVNKIDEFTRVMQRFAATGEVPQVDAEGNFVTDASKQPKVGGETFEKEMSYAELAQQREISMTQTFGRLLNFDRTGQMVPFKEGADPLATMETLEREAFGFTKLLETSEQSGRLMEMDPKNPGQMRVMTDLNLVDEDPESPTYNPEGVVDTLAARRFAWDKDVNLAREKWQASQIENDATGIELQAATVQFGQQLSALIEAGKLAEAIDMRKEKNKNDKAVLDHKKNEFKINTLMALAQNPSTMLFAQRNGILDDLGVALGVDFGSEQIPMPGRMTEPNTIPTRGQLERASPTEQQIMLAEVAAFDMMGKGYMPSDALSRLTQWQPGSKPLRRTTVTGATR